jgi:hypothetical protein
MPPITTNMIAIRQAVVNTVWNPVNEPFQSLFASCEKTDDRLDETRWLSIAEPTGLI